MTNFVSIGTELLEAEWNLTERNKGYTGASGDRLWELAWNKISEF